MDILRWGADIDSMAAALCFDLDIYMCTARMDLARLLYFEYLKQPYFVDFIVPSIDAAGNSSIYSDPEPSASK